jgi:hypothetical protein
VDGGRKARTTRGRGLASSARDGDEADEAGEWAASVRKDYQLDATDEQLVTLAESALGMALDPLQSRRRG